ncbi:Ras GTPase [Parelaphostrongylus tenuis]|uniref:Ras GTPase n=1 Tax=Parelaphostrongylus tenuis TaxID=148309 RepID=A0AAD5MMW0_PARTN|nr:Ras GTPase [Parelaphostrongylus tenuis]
MYDPTIEDRYKKTMIYKGKPAHLQIVDTAGKELVCEMMSRYILSADAFMVVYSVGSRKSFEHALYIFSQIARLRGVDSVARLLVAAMCDSDYREVSPEEGNTLSAQLHCSFAEASAKRNVNIEEVFEEMVSQLRYIETTSWKKEHASHRLKSSLCCFL